MLTFTYKCKKTGLDYDFTSDLEANAQDAYAWRRGLREYMDNYHASITKAGLVTSKGTQPWKHDTDFAEAVTAACDDAQARFNAGDVPGERVPTDPKVIELRKLGITESEWTLMREALAAARKAA